MRQLNGVYTQPFNRTYGRVGHVLCGRVPGARGPLLTLKAAITASSAVSAAP